MIKAVIFDIGGVLAYDVWENLLLDEKVGIAKAYNLDYNQVKQIGQTLWEQFAYITSSDWKQMEVDYWNKFSQSLGISTTVSEFIDLTDIFIKPIDGMVDLLRKLKSTGVELAICSNNTEFWFHRQAMKLDFYKYFSAEKVLLSCRVGRSKSSHDFEMFYAAVKSLGIDKQECILIDDREDVVLQALKYGLASIIFPSHSPYGARYLTALFERMSLL
jgi:HAD superfamily hydrolase (TIGR01509 family)